MAWLATTLWEVRGTGNDLNGGAFDPSFGGTDYTMQDAAQVSLGDFATPGAGSTTLTSASNPFTAQMVGNGFHPQTGGNFVEDFYCITAFVGAGQVTLDRSPTPGGAGAAGTGTVGGGLATLDKVATHADYVAGNKIWMQGNISLLGNVTFTVAGTAALPVIFEGYNITRGDAPLLNNRPLITGGLFILNTTFSYGQWRNMRITGTHQTAGSATQLYCGDYWSVHNCKVENLAVPLGFSALRCGYHNMLIGNEFISTGGYGVNASGSGIVAVGNYFHDSVGGLNANTGTDGAFNIFDTISGNGILLTGNYQDTTIKNNIFYACDRGLYGNGFYPIVVMNNIFKDCTTFGIDWTANYGINIYDYNDFHGNAADRNNVTAGAHDLAFDPQFTDAPGGDFSVGENLKAAGFPGAFDGGLSTGYLDMGAVQRQEPAAGGSSAWGCVT